MVLAVVCAAALAGACSAGADEPSGQGMKKTQIKVGAMKVAGTAPYFLAKKRGFFKDQGLQVKTVAVKGGAEGIPKVHGGSIDITYSNYISMFQALDNGFQLRVLADGYNTADNTLAIMASSDSGIRKPEDLAGKTIAVNTLHNQAQLLTKSVLKTRGVSLDDIKFVSIPFPDVPAALASDKVDAGFLVEPFITAVESKQGGRIVVDPASGATEGWPTAGWAATSDFVEKHPKTAKAFTKAMQHGAEVAQKRGDVEDILPSYTAIKPKTAAIMNLGEYPTSVDATRIQRVPDLMYRFGLIDHKMKADKLIAETLQ